MDKKETTKFLNSITAIYQNFMADQSARDQWHELFAQCSLSDAKAALAKFARNNSKGFAPTPGELFALLPKGSISQEESIEWAGDGASYTIIRSGERHTYICAPPAEKWAERKKQYARGYGLCVEKHARGHRTWYAPIDRCVKVGVDSFGSETLPRFEQR